MAKGSKPSMVKTSESFVEGRPFSEAVIGRGENQEMGKWGRTKYRRIPEGEGDWKGRVPKCSLPRKSL